MHMRMSLRAGAAAYEVAMPLLGPPEKLQFLKWNMYFDADCTCVTVSKYHRPLSIRTDKFAVFQVWKSGTSDPLANKFRRNIFADRNKFAVTPDLEKSNQGLKT